MSRRRKPPRCRKQRYATGGLAQSALIALQAKGHGELRFYGPCPRCGGYHLTSMPKAA